MQQNHADVHGSLRAAALHALGPALGAVSRAGARRAVVLVALAGGAAAWAAPEMELSTDMPVELPETPELPASPQERGWFSVTHFLVSYPRPDNTLPDLNELADVKVTLGVSDEGFVAPTQGLPTKTMTLQELNDMGGTFAWSAIETVSAAVVGHLNSRGVVALFVAPSAADIDENYHDLRKERGQGELNLFVWTGRVEEVRTIRVGDGIDPIDAVNDETSLARRVRDGSPMQVGDVVRRDQLDRFLYKLNRHPGRRVDASIAAADVGEPGRVALDYRIAESKPWTIYAQTSNTGTQSTSEWRQRFGFIHNQLTGNDDILTLDYSTASFAQSHGLSGSYEFPLSYDTLRLRFFGGWSRYTASDVGFPGLNFRGEDWSFGGEAIWNFYQHRDLFIDAVGGVRYENTRVTNELLSSKGRASLLIPSASLRVSRDTDQNSAFGAVTLEGNMLNNKVDDLEPLGRTSPDRYWVSVKWQGEFAFYLEPLLTNGPKTLAHEFSVGVRGQSALGRRVIPTQQQVIGGFFSVRGYDESIASGDNVVIGTGEYRFHLPRAFGTSNDAGPREQTLFGQPFRTRPTQDFGLTDWDLIFRAFADAGRTINNKRLNFEKNQTLVGMGVGVEFQLRRNISVRADWGFVVEEVTDVTGRKLAGSGDNRLHFITTLAF